MRQQATEVEFNVDDQVLVLLVDRSTREWVEQARVVSVCGDHLVVELDQRENAPLMPTHSRYVLHRCPDCKKEAVVDPSRPCLPCQANDLESDAWIWDTTWVYRFRWTSPYLKTQRPLMNRRTA